MALQVPLQKTFHIHVSALLQNMVAAREHIPSR